MEEGKEVVELSSFGELESLLFPSWLEPGPGSPSSSLFDKEEVAGKEISSISSFLGLVPDFRHSFGQ